METKEILVIVILSMLVLSGIGLVIYNYGPDLLATVTDYKTPIFCNDYEFTCCNAQVDSTTTRVITDEKSWICPPTSFECKILTATGDITGGDELTVGSGECELFESFFGDFWECSREQTVYAGFIMKPNEQVYIKPGIRTRNLEASLQIRIYEERLDFCGRAGCSVGVPVSGADACTFHPLHDKVYTTTGSLKSGLISYTVPESQCVLAFQFGDRHICGYKEEQCDVDTDCDGHTYGNQECYARTLQTYGCRNFGTQIDMEQDRLPWESNWGSDSSDVLFGSRCEIIKSEPVQCCGDTDCGTEFFCDTQTFTCEKEVSCDDDDDCGVSTICDWTTKELKTPKCVFGECAYSEQSVDCCLDANCPSGYYCTKDNKCDKSVVTKRTCPFECCVNEELYFDRGCPEGETCTDENTCTKTVSGKDKFNFNWLYLIPILLPLGLAGIFGWKGKEKTGEYYWLDFAIGGILGLGVGLLLYWIFNNWLVLLLMGLIGGGGIITVIFLIGGVPLIISIANMFLRKK